MSSNVTLLEHPLAAVKLSMLRSKSTTSKVFRENLEQISILLLSEASRRWKTRTIEIETPLKQSRGEILERPIIFVPILRAGLGMLSGMLRVLPEAAVGHVGIYRNEETLQAVTYFCRIPVNAAEAHVVLIDPMLATGNSASEAVSLLKNQGARAIQFVCVLACPQGIERLQSAHSDVEIVTATIDPELNKSGFIIPGLGDAGDRCFGTG